jgi:lipoprotein-anchoring transpeptidase ErfK/SrfK
VRSRWPAALLALSLLTVALTGCDDGAGASHVASPSLTPAAVQSPTASPKPTVSAAAISITPADGKKKVRLDSAIHVTATGGQLVTVNVRDAGGDKVKGELSVDGTTWTAEDQGLDAGSKYRITATAKDANGLATTEKSSFTTLTPALRGSAYLTPGDEWNVGVGMPVIVTLTRSVADSKRGDIEDAISVASKPETKGAWRWFSDYQLQWRPATYWKSGTKVSVTADLKGVEFRKGVWGKGEQTAKFSIGSRMVSTVDMKKHRLTVRKNGKVLRVIPITTGKPGFATRKGVKVIMGRESSRQMNSETTGIDKDNPEYYNLNVKWAMRLTYSGEFLHAAPWSVGSQGRANVSHGCTGMSTSNARWLFGVSKVGDVVKYVGGSRPMEWGNGYTAWNKTFKEWSTGA